LQKNTHKVGARQCTFIWSKEKGDIQAVHKFLEQYHIQGKSTGTKCVIVGKYKQEPVVVATFGFHHRDVEKGWALTRFCTKKDWTVMGALSKMSKMAFSRLQSSIVSWADFGISDGNGYIQAGWKFEELLRHDYFYYKGNHVYSKQSRQKRIVGTPDGMTEREHALKDGLKRVWDCGKIRFRYG
jgi:hypothetical protein